MTMKEDYQTAMDLLLDGRELNYKKIVIELAKENPKMFLKIVTPNRNLFAVMAKDAWKTYARQLIVDGKKVEAIKEIRAQAGYGLKEAKDVAELVEHHIFPMSAICPNTTYMPDEALELAQEIAA